MSSSTKTMRDIFGEALCELADEDERIIVVDPDVAHPTRAYHVAEKFSEQFVQLGVAEQNVIGFSAGLAALGFIPLVNMFACFAGKRVCDQVSVSVAYPKLNVKICGCYAGLTTPNTGATHQSIQDISIMRSMPNMVIIEPAEGSKNPLNEVYVVEDGDTVVIPRGYHPVAVAAGYQIFYLWALAGENRQYAAWSDDPKHAWIRKLETISRLEEIEGDLNSIG